MLVRCRECGKEVSDKASSCPGCGAPMTGVQTIEQTSKGLKAQLLISGIIFTLGLMSSCSGTKDGGSSAVSVMVALVGLTWYLSVRMMIWWKHK